ncbi:MAG: SH3 domain-containing protein [Methyloceanibacter sp.]|uniref:SH3 domain-containing protein n=1 Tax=Methyloceanibacter sp. TaxID=1965321 RepID=UPI003D9BAE99
MDQSTDTRSEAIVNGEATPQREASLLARLAAEAQREAGIGDDATPLAMAERFARLPEGWPVEAANATARLEALAPPPEGWRGSALTPALLVILILVALIPTAIIALLVMQGAIKIPGMERLVSLAAAERPGLVQQASVTAGPLPKVAAPKPRSDAPAIVLTAPDRIDGAPGGDVSFGLAIDSTDALPARSLIAIRSMPEGATFSQGRPYGATEWTLRPDEIADLRLSLPALANGAADLRTELVAADGRVLASASTALTIFDPRSDLIVRPQESERIADLIVHGKKMIAVGYFAGARAYFKRAAEAGSAEAALAVGATYDPVFIEQLGAHGIKPEPEQALSWYERARRLGLENPDAHIAELREEFETAGQETANAEAGAAAAGTAAQKQAADVEWVELSGSANVREGPSSTTPAIRTAPSGSRFQATGRKGNWIQVIDSETKEVGWIYARYIATAEVR